MAFDCASGIAVIDEHRNLAVAAGRLEIRGSLFEWPEDIHPAVFVRNPGQRQCQRDLVGMPGFGVSVENDHGLATPRLQYRPHEDRDTWRRTGRAHRGVPPVARRIERSHGRRYQRRSPARPAGPPRHPHRRRQCRLSIGARSGGLRLGRYRRRADLERRGQHDGLRGRVHAVSHAHQDRAHPLVRIHASSEVVRRRGAVGGRVDQPRAAGHRVHRAADQVSRRAAGAGLRRRPRAPGRHPRAQGRIAGRPAAAHAQGTSSRHRGARGGYLPRRPQPDRRMARR